MKPRPVAGAEQVTANPVTLEAEQAFEICRGMVLQEVGELVGDNRPMLFRHLLADVQAAPDALELLTACSGRQDMPLPIGEGR